VAPGLAAAVDEGGGTALHYAVDAAEAGDRDDQRDHDRDADRDDPAAAAPGTALVAALVAAGCRCAAASLGR
jgi:hypothetical protein